MPLKPAENWLPVVGYEGLYEVSDHGNVRSVDRTVEGRNGVSLPVKGRDLTLTADRYGYPTAHLYAPGVKPFTVKTHRLVLEAFVGPRPAGGVCRHLDGTRANNHISNLVWGTSAENAADMVLHGTRVIASQKAGEGHRKVTNAFNVKCVRQMAALKMGYAEIAKCFGVSKQTVCNIVRSKYGYDRFVTEGV